MPITSLLSVKTERVYDKYKESGATLNRKQEITNSSVVSALSISLGIFMAVLFVRHLHEY